LNKMRLPAANIRINFFIVVLFSSPVARASG
jgi:hypothetical protein